MFFFEKKNQKTFANGARVAGYGRDSGVKVFCFFSSEKKAFFLLKDPMQNLIEGIVTIVQESRFQLTDDAGVAHLFVLGHLAAAETGQLPALQRRQARVRVRYAPAGNVIGNVAHTIWLLS